MQDLLICGGDDPAMRFFGGLQGLLAARRLPNANGSGDRLGMLDRVPHDQRG